MMAEWSEDGEMSGGELSFLYQTVTELMLIK